MTTTPELTLSHQIAKVIGDDHPAMPDLLRTVEQVARDGRTFLHAFDAAAAALELLKAGMPASEVIGGGLDAARKLSDAGGLDATTAAVLVVTTVNTFGLGPKYFPVIPNYVVNIRSRS